jgi:hypothetical protein
LVGWRSIFFVNLPVVLALLLARKLPVDRGADAEEPLDVGGALLGVLQPPQRPLDRRMGYGLPKTDIHMKATTEEKG